MTPELIAVILLSAVLWGWWLAVFLRVEFGPEAGAQDDPFDDKAVDRLPSHYRFIRPLIVRCGVFVQGDRLQAHRRRVGEQLRGAGLDLQFSPRTWVASGIALSVVSALGVALVLSAFSQSISILPALLVGVLVYTLRSVTLSNAASNSKVSIDRELPYFLDIAALSMRGGLGFEATLNEFVVRSKRSPLAFELGRVMFDVEGGTPLSKALDALAKRTTSEDLATCLSVVVQAQELGTPVADVLSRQASLNRYRRMKRGEELSGKLPNRLALPVTFLMLGGLVLLFGPTIVRAFTGEGF